MMEEDKELIEYFAEKKRGGVDYSQIRKELASKGFDKERISSIIKNVDKLVLSENEKSRGKFGSKELKGIGFFLMIIGGLMTVLVYLEKIDLKGRFYFAWIPLVLGYYIIVKTRIADKKRKRMNISELEE